jgi:hypothetical protein
MPVIVEHYPQQEHKNNNHRLKKAVQAQELHLNLWLLFNRLQVHRELEPVH